MRIISTLVVLILVAVPAFALAQEEGRPEGAMLIILDASGSINALDQDVVPSID